MTLIETLLFLILIIQSFSQNLPNNCRSKQTCSECIQEVGCIWCINPESDNHCIHKDSATRNWCKLAHVVNPAYSFDKLDDREINTKSYKEGEAVQIRPQRVKLSLRKSEEYEFPFQYVQAKNYPVDLYYIMDLSASMINHKKKLASLGEKLAETMMNITNNFRLGFGSFVDKVAHPFVNTVPERLKQPCQNAKAKCIRPYSFKNHMPLSEDYRKFSKEVKDARVSGNVDSPEGGFDALMQAMVCKQQIGWRTQARHLLVFSTDADFHIAGDGKLAGVVEPNDAVCHMENNKYTHDLTLDYPSISQINYVAKENNINLIFAIVNVPHVVFSYKKLSQQIENSNTGTLDDKSKNVIKLVLDNYNKIVNSVTISTNSSDDVEVKILPRCPHPIINGCTKIQVGESVNFTATIKPLKCSKNGNKKIIAIKPEGVEESIIIELEVMCDCGCESKDSGFYFPNSDKCSNNGTLKCGVCDCNSGYFGEKCECNTQFSKSNDENNCKKNKDDTEDCSGKGNCICGQCQCNKRQNINEKLYGKYCDCDNFSCGRVGGKLCSDKGTCDCGVCRCQAGWTGDSCQCPDTNSTCVKHDNNNLICNGHGTCNCGKCVCFDEEIRYSGEYCDECPTCKGQKCEELRHCVECVVHKTGIYNEYNCHINCTASIDILDKLEDTQDPNIKTCTIADDKGCTFVFQYEYVSDKQLKVRAVKRKFCPSPPNILAWVLGVIGTILLAGLIILIIWKVCTTIHDRKEYAKFENEIQKMQWHNNDNPLYKEATSNFANPLYRRSRMFSFSKKS